MKQWTQKPGRRSSARCLGLPSFLWNLNPSCYALVRKLSCWVHKPQKVYTFSFRVAFIIQKSVKCIHAATKERILPPIYASDATWRGRLIIGIRLRGILQYRHLRRPEGTEVVCSQAAILGRRRQNHIPRCKSPPVQVHPSPAHNSVAWITSDAA